MKDLIESKKSSKEIVNQLTESANPEEIAKLLQQKLGSQYNISVDTSAMGGKSVSINKGNSPEYILYPMHDTHVYMGNDNKPDAGTVQMGRIFDDSSAEGIAKDLAQRAKDEL